ncbi:hypothetical protein K461DRAFT_324323 [Myriangium duriaei CBS 260.36]|uniref:Uncharacterized protein n=1 Tax=Myriangium duriaei CBS 260.36 TaxID=1168546 RepID=A0A9P4IW01_9PEZI|nr:hypothetical protein K461DRAFT_324323 [Myriangium duriaei CBS 260.36]
MTISSINLTNVKGTKRTQCEHDSFPFADCLAHHDRLTCAGIPASEPRNNTNERDKEDKEQAAIFGTTLYPKVATNVPSPSSSDNIFVRQDSMGGNFEPQLGRENATEPSDQAQASDARSKKRRRVGAPSHAPNLGKSILAKQAQPSDQRETRSRTAAASAKPPTPTATKQRGTRTTTQKAASAQTNVYARKLRRPEDRLEKPSQLQEDDEAAGRTTVPNLATAVDGQRNNGTSLAQPRSDQVNGKPDDESERNGEPSAGEAAAESDGSKDETGFDDEDFNAEESDVESGKAVTKKSSKRARRIESERGEEEAREKSQKEFHTAWYGEGRELLKAEAKAEKELRKARTPKTSSCKKIRRLWGVLKKHLGDETSDADILDGTINDTLLQITIVVEEWITSLKDSSTTKAVAQPAVNDIFTHAIPYLTVALTYILTNFGPVAALTTPQLELTVPLLDLINRLHTTVDKVCRHHAIKVDPQSPKVAIHKTIQGIMSRLRAASDRFTLHLADQHARIAQQHRLSQAATHAATQRAAETLRRTTLASKAKWHNRWSDLHALRRAAAMPTGLTYISPATTVHLADTPLLFAADIATAASERRQAWYARAADPAAEVDANAVPIQRVGVFGPRRTPAPITRAQDDGEEPWDGPEWSLEADEALMEALERWHRDEKEKVWEHVVWELCRVEKSQTTKMWKRGVLSEYSVAEVVERGVWIARGEMRLHWLRGEEVPGWTRVEDLRIEGGEGWLERLPDREVVEREEEEEEEEELEEEGLDEGAEEVDGQGVPDEDEDIDADLPDLPSLTRRNLPATEGTQDRPLHIEHARDNDDEISESEDEAEVDVGV